MPSTVVPRVCLVVHAVTRTLELRPRAPGGRERGDGPAPRKTAKQAHAGPRAGLGPDPLVALLGLGLGAQDALVGREALAPPHIIYKRARDV